MHECKNICFAEEGSTIVLVLVVLMLMTVIGISAVNMSTVEQTISVNDKNHKVVFYHGESGNFAMAKYVARVLDEDEVPPQTDTVGGVAKEIHRFDLEEGENTEDLKDEVYGYPDAYDEENDLSFAMTSGLKKEDGTLQTVTSEIGINIDRLKAEQEVGGGAEFGTGASGIGEETAYALPYWFTTTANGPGGSRSKIMSKYLKLNVPGGL